MTFFLSMTKIMLGYGTHLFYHATTKGIFLGVNRKNMLVDMAEIFIPDGSYSKIMLIKESTWPLKSALIIYYLLSLL